MESRREKKERKKKKLARLTDFQRNCRSPGMSCFTVDEDTWKEPPRWLGEPQCHCTSASNQTYACLRKIGIGAGNFRILKFISKNKK